MYLYIYMHIIHTYIHIYIYTHTGGRVGEAEVFEWGVGVSRDAEGVHLRSVLVANRDG
jgi:hypothetical protein